MRLAGRFSRRVRGYAKAHGIPVIDCPVGERKHELAEEYLAKTKVTQGLFLVLVGRAPAVVWTVGAHHHIERKTPAPYVNHYSFHILDRDWGHLTIIMPPGIDILHELGNRALSGSKKTPTSHAPDV